MDNRCCSCSVRLNRTSAVRPLKSPCLRMFMSIRTMTSLPSDGKVCNVCRHLYHKWKKENPEFSVILALLEGSMGDTNDIDDNSIDAMDVQIQTDDTSFSQVMEPDRIVNKETKNETVNLQLNATSSSHKKCCVCREDLHRNAVNISSKDRDFLLFSRNIWIPEGARCCSDHFIGDQLSKEAIDATKPFAIRHEELKSSDVQLLLNKSQRLFENEQKRFNFDDSRALTDDEYPLLTSLSRNDFNKFVEIISSSNIRNSCNRSVRTAIGIYLCKIRLGLSNRLLACMFQLPDKRTVSRIIDSARQAILQNFVPYNLGFGHITRRDVIDHHTTTIARELMCGGNSNTAILVIDGTYIYIQKSRNNQFQRKTYNLHKKRSLLKPMMIVTTTGYIVACIGPFFSDFKNNDASIMNDVLLRNTDNILNWLEEYDVLVVDRGFRDSISVMQTLGLDVAMPPFLDGQKQFSAEEANQSRCITKVRWVVEAANRRIKQFKYFANTIQNSSLIHLESDLSIVCALINRYQSPMATSKPEDAEISQKIMKLLQQKNKIQLLLEKNNLIRRYSQWETIDHHEIMDSFPIMSEEDLGDITFGVFQLKRARSYAEEKCSTTNLTGIVNYTIQRCKIISNLIRVPTQSAHSNQTIYHPTIQFTKEEVIGWWCDCYGGARFLGCCSHVSSAIWFLSYERWQTQMRHMPSGNYMNFATDAIQVNLSDFYDSSDGDDDGNSRYSIA